MLRAVFWRLRFRRKSPRPCACVWFSPLSKMRHGKILNFPPFLCFSPWYRTKALEAFFRLRNLHLQRQLHPVPDLPVGLGKRSEKDINTTQIKSVRTRRAA
ncbi:unnamed protein product, partial [Amoebophrya sp. A120]|eukprot:GSA120T00021472001.1